MNGQPHVLLALSGGVDSMVMADFFLKAKIDISVAHVNYHLRDIQSDMDQALVEKWCRKHQKTCHVHHVKSSEYKTSESIQMVARRIRYSFFEEMLDANGYDLVATAHNADDNFETVLLNLTRGTGINGLIGIAPKKDRLIRPLLFASKSEVYDYAKANRVEWREDKSNKKLDYQRNRIRNAVIPELKAINPNLFGTFTDTQMRLKGTAQLVEETATQLWEYMKEVGNHQVLALEWLDGSDRSLMLLSEFLKAYGFQFSQVKDVFGSILSRSSGATFSSTTHLLNVDRNQLFLKENSTNELAEAWVTEDSELIRFSDAQLEIEQVKGNAYEVDGKHVAYLDFDRIKFPLKLRNWKEGDSFRPLGMKGKKKVSDFMIDSKIPVTLKKEVLILESGDQIVWIVGLRIDDRFKVTAATTNMLKIQYSRHV